jgi:plastocyanin
VSSLISYGPSCRIPALTIIAFLIVAPPAAAGDISGQILITRKLSRKVVAPATYSIRGEAISSARADAFPGSEFDRMVIMLEGGAYALSAPEIVTIEQRSGRFEPDVVVISLGSTVQFPNSDPIFHNVFSLSHAHPFDLGYYAKSQSRSVRFDRPGVIQVYCHIHASMYAAIVVTASPWHGKPGPDGAFSWANVPAGRYQVVVWHKIAGTYTATVDVPQHGTAGVTIRVPVDVEPRH